jgi:hypothetical protein
MTRKATRPVVYPRDAILTIDEVAKALRVSANTVRRMDLPTIYVGRQPRYLWSMVLDTLAKRAQ